MTSAGSRSLTVTYLFGFLGPKAKNRVEALPFTPEDYNRAKAVLQEKYGKNAEMVKTYEKEIMDLPTITNANVRKPDTRIFRQLTTRCPSLTNTKKAGYCQQKCPNDVKQSVGNP